MSGYLANPELIRHVRMELRPRRMLIAFGVVALLCVLAYLGFAQDGVAPNDTRYLQPLYATYVVIQSVLLGLWCLSACSQAIAGERVQKTYDFLRTTRLTAGELVAGMVPGVPVMAYFTIACSLPFSILAGVAAGFSPFAIVVTYAMLALLAVVISLAGLNLSMLTDRPRAGELLVLVFFLSWPWMMLVFAMGRGSPLPGLSAIAVIPGILHLYGSGLGPNDPPAQVPFFAFQVPTLLVSVVIYSSLAGWLALALVRNLKKDIEEIRLLSHWQSIGFAAYLNILILALLDVRGAANGSGTPLADMAASVATGYLIFNWLVLYGVGITLLTPAESLKSWWRRSGSGLERYWSEDGPPWLWMIACAAVVLVLFTAEIAATASVVPIAKWSPGLFAGRLAVALIYCIRDVLFLQWCLLTRMKNPVTKGVLFLFLYYITVSIVISVSFDSGRDHLMARAFALVTPSGALAGQEWFTTVIGGAIQVVVAIVLLLAIERRISAKPLRLKAV